MTEIVSLHGHPLPQSDSVDPKIVETLERWLERAKSGQYTGIALAGVYRDGDGCSVRSGITDVALIGSTQLLLQGMTAALAAANEED